MQYVGNSLEHQWMPFTANRDYKADPRLFVRAEGIYLWNHKGDKILDASAGLFCCAAGHGRKEIATAVSEQLQNLDYSPPFQYGHPAAFEFARRLAQLLPETLNQIFFTCSGSEAVDSAMKIAYAYHRARGEGQRSRFISRERAYHGVNIGGTSLSGLVRNREAFGPGLAGVAHMRHTWLAENRFCRGQPQEGAYLAEDLQRMVDLYGRETIAACIVEPIAGSTGGLVPPVGYLERLREICDQHEILLIFDEVICGFGRTGKAFAAQSFAVTPDLMTIAKAMTNGAQPMGGVAVSDKVYTTITDAAAEGAIELFHGYTYSGHPAACAAGLATLDIYAKEALFDRAQQLSEYFLKQIFSLAEFDAITDIRGYGLLAGFDLKPADKPGARGTQFLKDTFAKGLYVKMTGDAGVLAPPLTIEKNQIDAMCDMLRDILRTY